MKKKIATQELIFEQMGKLNPDFKKPVNEVFGWSVKEKEAKANKEKIEKAKEEVGKYNFNRIFFMPAQSADGAEFVRSKEVRINGIKQELPLLAELMPHLFDPKQGSANMMMRSGPNEYQGYIPANWFGLVRGRDGYINNDLAIENLNKEIDGLGQKMGLKEYSYPENAETYQRLIDTAIKDGHITPREASAEYISSTAKEIATEFDRMGLETHWDRLYKDFLKTINEIGHLNIKYLEEEEKWMQGAVEKPGALHKELGIPEDEKIPMELINKKLSDLRAKAKGDKKLSPSELKTLQRLNFAKTAKKVQNEAFGDDEWVAQQDAQMKQKHAELLKRVETLFDEGEYEAIETLYRLLVRRGRGDGRIPSMNEDHNPVIGQKVEDIKGGLQYMFDTDQYDAIEKIYKLFEKLFGNVNPEMPAPELE